MESDAFDYYDGNDNSDLYSTSEETTSVTDEEYVIENVPYIQDYETEHENEDSSYNFAVKFVFLCASLYFSGFKTMNPMSLQILEVLVPNFAGIIL